MRHQIIDLHTVLQTARVLWKKPLKIFETNQTEERRFRATFGCGSLIVVELWGLMRKKKLLPEKTTISHLMNALLFLKLYPTEKTLSVLTAGRDAKTNRKWIWKVIAAISELEDEFVSFNLLFFNFDKVMDQND